MILMTKSFLENLFFSSGFNIDIISNRFLRFNLLIFLFFLLEIKQMLTIDNGGLQKNLILKYINFYYLEKLCGFCSLLKNNNCFFTIMSTKCRLWKNYVIFFREKNGIFTFQFGDKK